MAGEFNTREINEKLYSEGLKETTSLGDLDIDGTNILE
jgi:hypothetical protein